MKSRRTGIGCVAAAGFVLVACGSAWAGAKGGPILIDQSSALRGGVTPGDLPGFPVSITQPGSYRLNSNLDVRALPAPQNLDAILITAANVDLDLAGFSILGPVTCTGNGPTLDCMPIGTGHGVIVFPGGSARVHDGLIRGMGNDGVQDVGIVENVRTRENAGAGFFNVETVTGCEAVRNRSVGILAGVNSLVRRNRSIANGNFGIGTSNHGAVIENVSSGNANVGIFMSGTTGFAGNVVNGNVGSTQGGVETGPNVCDGAAGCP